MHVQDFTGDDEGMPARAFLADEVRDPHDVGNWPELAGLVFTAVVVWMTFGVTG